MNMRGNALFLILIAVALFAALSYAVTSSGRGGGDISREKATLAAAQISQFITAIRLAVERMGVTGGYGNIEFFHGGSCADGHTLCDSGESCLFASEGGGATLPVFPAEFFAGPATGMGYPGDVSSQYTTHFWIDCDEDMTDWALGSPAPERGFYS